MPAAIEVDTRVVQRIQRVAVLPFGDAPGADAGRSGRVVAGAFCQAAMRRPGWQVLERQRIDTLLKEMKFQLSDLVDTQSAVEIGKFLGADAVVLGSVSQYEIGSIPFLFFLAFDKNVYRVGFNLRLVDVETAALGFTASIMKSGFTSLEDCSQKAANEVVDALNKRVPCSPTGSYSIMEVP